MPAPATRLLMLLEILQDQPLAGGRELAERLGVDVRTVRRYAVALQELGIPVQGERGPAGGYRIAPGYKLPPLMLTDAEAGAIVLGLLAAQRFDLGTSAPAVDGALAKLRRVLPATLAAQLSGLEETLGFTHAAAPGDAGTAPRGDTVLRLADAARRGRRVLARYTTHGGEESARELSPHGLVFHAGRWYLAAHDHGRGALRTFRVDRLGAVRLGEGAAEPPPPGFEAVAHVSRSLARVPWAWDVEVLVDTDHAHARVHVPPTLGELEPAPGGGVLLRMRVESLDYMAALLARLDRPFTVHRPAELRDEVDALADRLRASARR